MKNTIIFFFLFLFLFAGSASSQNNDEFNETILQTRVKQLDEFFFIFNNNTNNVRRENIIQLFERDYFLGNDSLCNNFVESILSDSMETNIGFYDTGWFALVNCKLNFKKTTVDGSITLKVSTVNGASKWEIIGVNANNLHFLSTKVDSSKILNPYSHETNFINLRNAFIDTANYRQYIPRNFTTSNLTLFMYLLKKGEIQFVNVKSVTLSFTQIENWVFEVSFINRLSHNSGWLITNLLRLNKSQKQEYINTKLNLE